jgi:integrase
MSLGEHGLLTPDEARSEAKKVLGAVEAGADPIAKRRDSRAVRTFREIADEFLTLHVQPKRKDRTREEYERLLKLHVYPAIGSKRVSDVSTVDLGRMHAALLQKPVIANKALAVVSSIWNWAARREEVSALTNPAKGIERYREERRERFLTTEELGRLGDALREAETIGIPWDVDEAKATAKHAPANRRVKFDPFAVAAIRLLVLTGARLREVLHLQWSQVDIERGMAFLPTSKTSQGALPIGCGGKCSGGSDTGRRQSICDCWEEFGFTFRSKAAVGCLDQSCGPARATAA